MRWVTRSPFLLIRCGGEKTAKKNPRDLIGIVAKVTGSCKYCYVVWENGIENSYGESDLKVLGNTGMTPKEVEFWYE